MNSSTTNSYHQYKDGTKAVLKWLSESLDKLGITLDGKLEDVSIRSLLDLASRVQNSGASMPYEVLYALKDVLKIRRQYHSWYSGQFSQSSSSSSEENKNVEQSNKAHAAFIDVLQYIHDLFAPAKTPTDQLQSSIQLDKKILEITNLFAKLEAEDVAEEGADIPMAKSSSGAEQPAKPWMVRKSQMLIEDKLLELYCLFNDAYRIRCYLRQKWVEYAERKIDIMSAAIITQEALELFSEIEQSFEDKYGTIPENDPGLESRSKHLDIIYYLAIGEPMTSTYTLETYKSMSEEEIKAAKLHAQSTVRERQQRIANSGWRASQERGNWLMLPASCVLQKMINKGDDWVLKQACRTSADRVDLLHALEFDETFCRVPAATARLLLDTFINVYAGMVFIRQNLGSMIVRQDIITSLWLKKYDCSIRMVLSMQILHDIRTATSGSGQLGILTRVSKDYNTLGPDFSMFSGEPQGSLAENRGFQSQARLERSWLRGRVPGQITRPSNMKKAKSQTISRLPLIMNPVLAGMFLFQMSYKLYLARIICGNDEWFLIPCAHLINWLAVTTRGTTADFQALWPDIHTVLGLVGPRSVWLGASPPETLELCRSRILLAWGLRLQDFYQRTCSGDIPKAEELFRKIKNNTNSRHMVTREQFGSVLDGNALPSGLRAKWKASDGLSHPLKIETSQCTPLLDAVQKNLQHSELMKSRQSHIQKIVLASFAATGNTPRGRDELDMLSYLAAFSRTAQAEMPRLLFPYRDLAMECCQLSCSLFTLARDGFKLSSDIWECEALVHLEDVTLMNPNAMMMDTKKLGSGAQSVSSLLALATIFGDRAFPCPLEHLLLKTIVEDWRILTTFPSRDKFTKEFVEKCKKFGFEVPECAMAALSSSSSTA